MDKAMSAAGRANSNQWMVDLATSAKREVDTWPAWKKENMGVSQSSGTRESRSSGGGNAGASAKTKK
jgi:hypothetical protein